MKKIIILGIALFLLGVTFFIPDVPQKSEPTLSTKEAEEIPLEETIEISDWKRGASSYDNYFSYPAYWKMSGGDSDVGSFVEVGDEPLYAGDGLHGFSVGNLSLWGCPHDDDQCNIGETILLDAATFYDREKRKIEGEGFVKLMTVSVGGIPGEKYKGFIENLEGIREPVTRVLLLDGVKKRVYIISDMRLKNNGDASFDRFLSTFVFP